MNATTSLDHQKDNNEFNPFDDIKNEIFTPFLHYSTTPTTQPVTDAVTLEPHTTKTTPLDTLFTNNSRTSSIEQINK
jgi:hypothetical protein